MAILQPHPVEIERPDISGWAQSNCGDVPYVHEFSSANAGSDVLISALVHGNEYAGAIAVHELLGALSSGRLKPRAGRITALFANVQAFQKFDLLRPDASRFIDQDFNRLWSMDVLHSTATNAELERAREIRPFVERATHLLDLHSMHEPCAPLLITGMLGRNVRFAQRLDAWGQVVMDAGHQDGVRLRDFGDFGKASSSKIALLLEAGQHWQASSVSVSRDVLMRFLLQAGVITQQDILDAGMQSWLASDRVASAPVKVTHAVVARSMRFAFTAPYVGNEVFDKAGAIIAHDDGEPVVTPYDDCVLIMPSIRQLRPGVTTVRFGQRMHAPLDAQPSSHEYEIS
jgi:predicted deacylase